MTTITALPAAPSRADPANFAAKGDALLAALGTFVTETNTVAGEVNTDATTATTQAGIATTQAGIATTQAGIATTQAGIATTQAGNALTSASNAAISETSAEASRIAADKRYLGAKASAPTLDNQGAALQTGAVYYNSTTLKVMTWNGSAWAEGISAIAGVSSVNGLNGDVTITNIALTGDLTIYVTQEKTYTITNYNVFSTYSVSATAGSISRVGDTITYTAPATAQSVTITVTMDGNGTAFPLTILAATVATPTITAPTSGETDVIETPTITTSAFATVGLTDTHLNSDWEIWTGANRTGTLIASSYADASNLVSWTVTSGLLSVSTTYYPAVLHRGTTLGASAWVSSSFTTAATFNSYIATPTATPGAFGDALDGGFYSGMIWNQIAQAADSKALATGTQAFTVPDMTGAAIVYAGQTLEVRSRANPANKFIGTVTGANGTTLTLNVSSIGGSGTYNDWSVMAQFRLVVAPKSSGENAAVAIKNATTALPTACQTLTEGWASTEAMKNADTSTVYPAAHWARGLTINSKSDWYIPARDELELCWRNLKPTTDANYVTANRGDSAINYKNLGSLDDTVITHGTNNNTSPTGAAYTTTVPGQVAATTFRTGGAEAFEYGAAYYWSSSEFSAASAWYQYWDSASSGYQNSTGKADANRVRAVRRSII